MIVAGITGAHAPFVGARTSIHAHGVSIRILEEDVTETGAHLQLTGVTMETYIA
jgi:hypothetical protein